MTRPQHYPPEPFNNTFKLNPGAIVFNCKYEMRAKVRTDGGNTPNGIITLRKR